MNVIHDQDPAVIVSKSAARHFAILIADENDQRMYWSGNRFRLFDDDCGAYADVRLWSAKDAVKAYHNALNLARQDTVFAGTLLQIVPMALPSFAKSVGVRTNVN